MKFSEIRSEDWLALQPYLDTCLLPVSGLTGLENPVQTAEQLENLRDILDMIEVPFKGRVVTYPAVQYQLSDSTTTKHELNELAKKLKKGGFRYVFGITASQQLTEFAPESFDLWIGLKEEPWTQAEISRKIQSVWISNPSK